MTRPTAEKKSSFVVKIDNVHVDKEQLLALISRTIGWDKEFSEEPKIIIDNGEAIVEFSTLEGRLHSLLI
jgi:hypothetical protein